MPLPPGPNHHPLIQMARWIRNPFTVLEEGQRSFGDTFSLRLAGLEEPVVIVSSPEAVKDVFALGADEGHAGKANVVLKPFLGEHSLLLLDGAEHLRQRKMMLPAFHGERMSAYGRSMIDLAHEAVDRFPLGRPFPAHGPMQSVTLQVIIRTVFGIGEGPRFAELADVLTRTLQVAAWPGLIFTFMQHDLGPLSPWGRFTRLAARASELLRSTIRAAQAKGTQGRTDVLAMLLDARDEGGRALSEDEVHDELMTLLIAGHETTATALAWALRWILPDAPLVRRLRDEIATAGDDPQRIAKLELLDATVREALRLQPIIPMVARVLQEPAKFGQTALPAGSVVAPAIYLVHRRPSLYPEPERFNPDRFRTFKPAPWEWLPFGGGLRRCIGAAFAIYEMKMVLGAMLPRVDARLATSDVRVSRRSITIAPSGGLPIVVTARRAREAVARAA
ncbi:MAG: cytochrome P450 [Polyangiaceae bacterium]